MVVACLGTFLLLLLYKSLGLYSLDPQCDRGVWNIMSFLVEEKHGGVDARSSEFLQESVGGRSSKMLQCLDGEYISLGI